MGALLPSGERRDACHRSGRFDVKWVTVISLVLAGLGQMLITAIRAEYNTAVGLGIGAMFLLLAAVAATGRWWATGTVAVLSGLLTLAAIGQLSDRIESGSPGEVLTVLTFQFLTLTAATTGLIAAARAYQANHVN
jgi:hypothetical protein